MYTAHYASGAVEEIAGAKSILQKIHPNDDINTIEFFEMPLEDFIKYSSYNY